MKTFLALFLLWAFVSSRLAFGVASTASVSATASKVGSPDDGRNDDLSEEYSGEDSEESGESWEEVTSAKADSKASSFSRAFSRASNRSPADTAAEAKASKHFQERAVPDPIWISPHEEKLLMAAQVAKREMERAARVALQLQREAEARAKLLQDSSREATRKSVRAAVAEMTSAMDRTSAALLRSEVLLEQFRRDLAHLQGSVAYQNAAAEIALEKAKEVKRHSRSAYDAVIAGANWHATTLQKTQNQTALAAEASRELDKVTSLVVAAINKAEAAMETELKALIDQTYKTASHLVPKLAKEKP